MSKILWQKTYQFIVLPLMFIIVHLVAIFSKNIREGLFPRRKTILEMQKWLEKNKNKNNYVLFHAASLGEFEHIKPLLIKLKEKYQTTNVLTFFSPSGYKNVKDTPGLDFYLYMPFDFPSHWKKLYKILEPKILIISKHDVWPMQIWQAKQMNIHTFLVNASLPEKSSRTKPLIKNFQKHVYRDFSKIFTISEEDGTRFSKHYPRCSVKVIGDTKYDQVSIRKTEAKKKNLLPESWYKNKWIYLAGSIWPEDEKQIMNGLINLLTNFDNVNLIIAPHEPNKKFIHLIETKLSQWGIIKFTQIKEISTERVLLIDTIGQLADLYQYAHAAYVGGSFKQGIHNVMEPAIYGIPVIYGPIHENSYEAICLAKSEGGIIIEDESRFTERVNSLVKNNSYREKIGENAFAYVQKNIGATDKIIKNWDSLLNNDSLQ